MQQNVVFATEICIFEINSKVLSLVAKNIQASLISFYSFIRIFVGKKAKFG